LEFLKKLPNVEYWLIKNANDKILFYSDKYWLEE
jgi:hypothetical protein